MKGHFAVSACLVSLLATATPAQSPTVIANVLDGTIHDVAASDDFVAVAQGGRVAFFSTSDTSQTPPPFYLPEFTYDGTIGAVEWDVANTNFFTLVNTYTGGSCDSGGQLVPGSTATTLYFHELNPFSPRVPYVMSGGGGAVDFKLVPGKPAVAVASGADLIIVDFSVWPPQETAIPVSHPLAGTGVTGLSRLNVHQNTNGDCYVYGVGKLITPPRDKNGLLVIRLDFSGAAFTGATIEDVDPTHPHLVWDPNNHFTPGTNGFVSAGYVEVASDATAGTDTAWIACGQASSGPIVARLDVTAPATGFPAPTAIQLSPGACSTPATSRAANIVLSSVGSLAYVTTENLVHAVDTATGSVVACGNFSSFDGGHRDMALSVAPGTQPTETIWMGIHHQVPDCIVGVNVSNPVSGTPGLSLHANRWWISSSDGGVAVPEWDSVYLPTFGGIARWSVTTLAPGSVSVQQDDSSFQPTGSVGGPTEHIDFLRVSPNAGFVLTVSGSGGMQAFPVRANQLNPAPPITVDPAPTVTNDYANDVGVYTSASGTHYVLTDYTDRTVPGVTSFLLRAYRYVPPSGSTPAGFVLHKVSAPVTITPTLSQPTSHVLHVTGDWAIVGADERVFVVDLLDLETSATSLGVTHVEDITPGNDGCRGIYSDGTWLFLALDGGAEGVMVHPWNDVNGTFGASVFTLSEDAECTPIEPAARLRKHTSLDRLYLATAGRMVEMEYDPLTGFLTPLSVWDDGSNHETQDCRVYAWGVHGPLVLFVKNNQAFALLDPDDGL